MLPTNTLSSCAASQCVINDACYCDSCIGNHACVESDEESTDNRVSNEEHEPVGRESVKESTDNRASNKKHEPESKFSSATKKKLHKLRDSYLWR